MLLLSRFWYLFLSVITATSIGAALLGQGIINNRSDRSTTEQLKRDRFQLEAMMRLEARRRIDRIAFITVDSKTGNILQQAKNVTDPKKLWELNSRLKGILRNHVLQMVEAAKGSGSLEERKELITPDIAIAVDSNGRIIAQLGPLAANPPGTGMGTFPLVSRAIRGYLRDDVWVYDRRVYRMAARPIIYGGQYVGAILHGYRYDSVFVQKLAKTLGGAEVAFFYGTDILASYNEDKGPSKQQLETPLQHILNDSKFNKGESTDPVELADGSMAIYSMAIGSAAKLQVGYVIARPRDAIASPTEMFNRASEQDIKSLPFPLLISIAFGLFSIGILFLFLERDKPFRKLLQKTRDIAKGERDRLVITEWRGGFRKLADQINLAIDKEVETAARTTPSRKKVDLDEILGPTPEDSDTGDFFGFATDKKNQDSGVQADVIPPAPPAIGQSQVNTSPNSPTSPKQKAPTLPDPALKKTPTDTNAHQDKLPVIPSSKEIDSSQTQGNSPLNVDDDEWDEDVHFKDIFEQYLSSRKNCGENTDNLSFEKFLQTLQKNRDQIIRQHGVQKVRFSVYIKKGKTALKAVPLKK